MGGDQLLLSVRRNEKIKKRKDFSRGGVTSRESENTSSRNSELMGTWNCVRFFLKMGIQKK